MAGLLTNLINESEELQKVAAQEDLIFATTEQLWGLMEEKGISKKQLAKKMGKSKSYITQLLSGSRNLTLKTLSDIAFALSEPVEITVGSCERASIKADDTGWFTTTVAVNDQTYGSVRYGG